MDEVDFGTVTAKGEMNSLNELNEWDVMSV